MPARFADGPSGWMLEKQAARGAGGSKEDGEDGVGGYTKCTNARMHECTNVGVQKCTNA